MTSLDTAPIVAHIKQEVAICYPTITVPSGAHRRARAWSFIKQDVIHYVAPARLLWRALKAGLRFAIKLIKKGVTAR